MILTAFHGFCMALADSVPGLSGGTIAFILGFYDRFLDALHSLFGRNADAWRAAVRYLLKLGAGWVIGMGPAGLDVPQPPVGLRTFDIAGFMLGVAALLGLEALRRWTAQHAGPETAQGKRAAT